MKKNQLITNILVLFMLSLHINIYSITEKQKWIGYGVGILFLYNTVTYTFQEESRKKEIEIFEKDISICNNIKTAFSNIPDPEDNDEAIEKFNTTIHKMIYTDYYENLKYIFGGVGKFTECMNNLLKNHGIENSSTTEYDNNLAKANCDFKNNFFPQYIDEYLKPMINNKKYAEESPRKYNFDTLKKDTWWIETNLTLSCFIGIAYCLRRE